MGSSVSLDDNQESEYVSGGSRLMNSLICAICIAPLMILGLTFTVGWNERRTVCNEKAMIAGEDQVEEVSCTMHVPLSSSLVMFACDIQKPDLPEFSPGGDFAFVQFQGVGIQVKSEMLQCVEEKETKETKSHNGGGGTTRITTYKYRLEWKDTWVDSGNFHKKSSKEFQSVCGAENPRWPESVPRTRTEFATSMKVGQFTVNNDLVRKVKLGAALNVSKPPAGWTREGGGWFETDRFQVKPRKSGQGRVRVRMYGNDWRSPTVTVLGHHRSGRIGPWRAPDSWLCSGVKLYDLRMGTVDKEDLFAALKSENMAVTWMIRVLGLLGMWCACSFLLGPLEVVADCFPFVGPCLGDFVEAVTCCVACVPATMCFLGVFGVVWMAMRPWVGIPLVVLWLAALLAFSYARVRRMAGEKPNGLLPASPGYGAVSVAQAVAQPSVAQAVATRQMQVAVPAGSGPGDLVQVQTPEGTLVQTTIPAGVSAGGAFMISY